MAKAKPYYTTTALIESIKARIAMPLSQSTYQYNDIVRFLNEELQLNAVPAVKEAHEEYFVFKTMTPLVDGISRYPIPDRAIGMALRDLAWSDSSGNFFKMSRVAPEDKAFFQQNVGSNQAIGKYYLEGNEVVLTPQVSTGAVGNLNFFIFLRPNLLVRDDRAATIQSFLKTITIDNATIAPNNTITITTGNQTPTPVESLFTAVTGSPSTAYEFQIGGTSAITAANLNTAITNLGLEDITNSISGAVITINYNDLSSTFVVNGNGITVDNNNTYIQFDQLPSTYTDPDTNLTENLYTAGELVDFLQMNPGHRTYTYDIKLRQILAGNIGVFKTSDLQSYLNNSSGGLLQFLPIKVGDYICLANECIIPQIPPELHNALAERAAGRILMAMGDMQGYQVSQAKVAEMDKKQGTLIGSRIEGSVPKVFNSMSLLRLGKRSNRRRI